MLTKTEVMDHLQCPRKLWLAKNYPGLAPIDDSSKERRTMDGKLVGEKARQALGAGALWPTGDEDKAKAAQAAMAQMLDAPDKVFVEMPFYHDGLYVRSDAVVPADEGYVLQETKASTFPLKTDKVTPGKPEAHYLEDAALQAWAMAESGVPPARVELNLLDSRWRYPGHDVYDGLFRRMDVTEEVQVLQAQVPTWLREAEHTVTSPMPDVHTGAQCKKPHDCQYQSVCKQWEPPPEEHPIELLPDSAGKSLAKKLRADQGYTSILEPAESELVGAQALLYRRIQRAHRIGAAILEPGADVIMKALPYPRYYFDFEGIDLPVPRWEGVRPYEQIPFQWSCHVERAPGVFEHYAFLDLTGDDPSQACIARMREVIDPDDNGPILVFYQTYEKGRLEGFAERHPEHKALMEGYIARLFDLHPMVKKHFYHPDMKGSFSIKKVLPVIAPDLSYDELEGVQEGTGAQVAYLNYCFEMGIPPSQREELRRNMLKYCEQDTWAMVEVGYFLEGLPRPLGMRPPGDMLVLDGALTAYPVQHAA